MKLYNICLIIQLGLGLAIPVDDDTGRSFGVFKAEVRDSSAYPVILDPTKINKVTCGSYWTVLDNSSPSLTVSADACLLGLILASFGAIPLIMSQQVQTQADGGVLGAFSNLSKQLANSELENILQLPRTKLEAFQKKFKSIRRNFLSSKAQKRTMTVREAAKKQTSLADDLDSMVEITGEELETFNELSKEDQEDTVNKAVSALEHSFENV